MDRKLYRCKTPTMILPHGNRWASLLSYTERRVQSHWSGCVRRTDWDQCDYREVWSENEKRTSSVNGSSRNCPTFVFWGFYSIYKVFLMRETENNGIHCSVLGRVGWRKCAVTCSLIQINNDWNNIKLPLTFQCYSFKRFQRYQPFGAVGCWNVIFPCPEHVWSTIIIINSSLCLLQGFRWLIHDIIMFWMYGRKFTIINTQPNPMYIYTPKHNPLRRAPLARGGADLARAKLARRVQVVIICQLTVACSRPT